MCNRRHKVQFQAENKPKFWTDNGLTKLGQLIRIAREKRKLPGDDKAFSLQRAADEIFIKTQKRVSAKTIGNVENGIGIPQYNTLAAIAAAGFVTDENGRPLTIDDFVDIACENPLPSAIDVVQHATPKIQSSLIQGVNRIVKFSEMIREAMLKNGITQDWLEDRIQKISDTDPLFLTVERLREIQRGEGEYPLESERAIIHTVIDPSHKVYSYGAWTGTENPVARQEPRERENGRHANYQC
jgi:transcriptional regulator with XRE-family HTH domain